MERALKSFLDGISDDDNVVNLEEVVKNDNEDEEEGPAAGVIAQGNASGMLDMRAMAQRYQEMSASSIDTPSVVSTSEAPLPGQILRRDVLAPILEADDVEEGRGLLIAGIALAVLVTIVSTAAVTAVWVKSSVMAEIREMQLTPQTAVTQNPVAVATNAGATEARDDVAEWPTVDPALATENKDAHLEMNFHESEVDAMRRRREREERKNGTSGVDTPVTPITPPVDPVTPTTTTTTTETPTTTTTTPTPEGPKPTVAADGEPCDEVLCLVEGRGCCGSVKKPKAAPEVDTSLPERLVRDDLAEGLKKVNGRLSSCGTRFEVSGVVKLKLTIGADGKVKKSTANQGDAEFKSCISGMLKKARFAKTQQGATLSYPVILR